MKGEHLRESSLSVWCIWLNTGYKFAHGFRILLSNFCMTSLLTASITFYVEYRKSDICFFELRLYRLYSEFETSQFFNQLYYSFIIETFVESSTKLGSCNCIILLRKRIYHASDNFSRIYNVVKNDGRASLEFSKFALYVTWPLSPCYFACFAMQNFNEIGQSAAELWPKKQFLIWRTSAILN